METNDVRALKFILNKQEVPDHCKRYVEKLLQLQPQTEDSLMINIAIPRRHHERFQKKKYAIVYETSGDLRQSINTVAENPEKMQSLKFSKLHVFQNVVIAFLSMNQKINTFARSTNRFLVPRPICIFSVQCKHMMITTAHQNNRPVHYKINWDLLLAPPNYSFDKREYFNSQMKPDGPLQYKPSHVKPPINLPHHLKIPTITKNPRKQQDLLILYETKQNKKFLIDLDEEPKISNDSDVSIQEPDQVPQEENKSQKSQSFRQIIRKHKEFTLNSDVSAKLSARKFFTKTFLRMNALIKEVEETSIKMFEIIEKVSR